VAGGARIDVSGVRASNGHLVDADGTKIGYTGEGGVVVEIDARGEHIVGTITEPLHSLEWDGPAHGWRQCSPCEAIHP
jgi:hypothetical protein